MSDQNNELELDVDGHRQGLLEDADSDVEGHRVAAVELEEDTEGHRVAAVEGEEDTEGHRVHHIEGDDDDVEGHRLPPYQVQPPRDTDLGGSER